MTTEDSSSNKSYYEKGSVQPAVANSVTVRKLEKRRQLTKTNEQLVIVLVGLPGRGKSFLSRKLHAFLTWKGASCKVFNVGKYRREANRISLNTVSMRSRSYSDQFEESKSEDGNDSSSDVIYEREEAGACDANFFDPKNFAAKKLREKVAMVALDDMFNWLNAEDDDEKELTVISEQTESEQPDSTGVHDKNENLQNASPKALKNKKLQNSSRRKNRISIFDATNSTEERRNMILDLCAQFQTKNKKNLGVVFVESICDDKELLEENFRYKVSTSPDFKGMSEDEAFADLRARAQKYEDQYETIENDSLSYIKIFNLSSKVMSNNIYGRMSKELIPALMAWHIGSQPILICRAGKTFREDNDDSDNELNSSSLTSLLAKASIDMSSHSDQSTSGNNSAEKNPRRSLSQSQHLGDEGGEFRDALRDFVTNEGLEWMKAYDEVFQHKSETGTVVKRGVSPSPRKGTLSDINPLSGTTIRSLVTGTSISGIGARFSGLPTPLSGDTGEDERAPVTHTCGIPLIPTPSRGHEGKDSDVPTAQFPCMVMTSTMPRAIQTAKWNSLPFLINEYSNLNPLDKGDFAGMEMEEIKEKYPDWYTQLESDPFGTRFPGGECYQDLVNRLATCLVDMEQQVAPVLVVSHVSIIQCLLSYFRGTPVEECTTIEVPMHTVFKMSPLRGGGWLESRRKLVQESSSIENDSNCKDTKYPIWGDK